jgi:hypothetical protein
MAPSFARSLRVMPLLLLWFLLHPSLLANAFSIHAFPRKPHRLVVVDHTQLSMGLFDSLVSNFLKSRDGDFVRLEETKTFGPGPVLLLSNVPPEIDDEEIQDILSDAAPMAFQKTVRIARITNDSTTNDNTPGNEQLDDTLFDLTLHDALNQIMCACDSSENPQSSIRITARTTTTIGETSDKEGYPPPLATTAPVVVMVFSGFDNQEMMTTYNLVGKEIYHEVGVTAACAKAVPNAMHKSLRQVLSEIANDHVDAILLESNNDNDMDNTVESS